MEKIKRYPLS